MEPKSRTPQGKKAARADGLTTLMDALQHQGRLIVAHIGPPRDTASPMADIPTEEGALAEE